MARRQKLDQRTRSECRLVITISGVNLSLWLRSTCISQSLATSSGHEPGGEGSLSHLSPSQINYVASCGTVTWAFDGMTLLVTPLFPCSVAKHFSTWLWCQVYLSWIRLVLQPTSMCLRLAGAAYWRQAGSSPTSRCRLVGEGGMSYMALMMKPSLLCSMWFSSSPGRHISSSNLAELGRLLWHTWLLSPDDIPPQPPWCSKIWIFDLF